MNCNSQIPGSQIAFGIRPQAFAKTAGSDIPPAQSDQRLQQTERPVPRFAFGMDRPLIDRDAESPERKDLDRRLGADARGSKG